MKEMNEVFLRFSIFKSILNDQTQILLEIPKLLNFLFKMFFEKLLGSY